MSLKSYSTLLLSDFNTGNFAGLLANNDEYPALSPVQAPYGQVLSVLMNDDNPCLRKSCDYAVVWTQPERVIESYKSLLVYRGDTNVEAVLAEVDDYCSSIKRLEDRCKAVFVPTWVEASCSNLFNLLDMGPTGPANVLMRMNLRLEENFRDCPGIHVLNSQKWINATGQRAFSAQHWYMAKVPYADDFFTEAVLDIKSSMRGITGNSKKLVILDLDNTLWGGVVGEVGWEHIVLGGHDPEGEAFVDFQRELLVMSRRGILLAIVSKNEEAVALEALEKHPEMVLRPEDFVGWRINWNEKAGNVSDLVSELNLGIDSVVFIDDEPAERDRVAEALPEVTVPEWPRNRMLYKQTLMGLRLFNTPAVTAEDTGRLDLYRSEASRAKTLREVVSFDEWLQSLGMKVVVKPLHNGDLKRVAQLINKTNQMNLRNRRMPETEIEDWVKSRGALWSLRVTDKFGDMGLVGVVSVEVGDVVARIIDFLLSCRVMGRKLEEAMLHVAVCYAQSLGMDQILAEYIPTKKNKPCNEFFARSGFALEDDGVTYSWDLGKDYPIPDCIDLQDVTS